jgi:hypothetical protein
LEQQKGSRSQVKESGKVMVRRHKVAIALFAKAFTVCKDPEIK